MVALLSDAAIGALSGYMGGAAGRSTSKAIFSGLASPAIKGSARPAAQLGQGIGAGIVGNGVGTAANYVGTGSY
jgi:hypothetical protein